jgi:hypothetical protein
MIGGITCSSAALIQFLIKGPSFAELYRLSFTALVGIYLVGCALAGVLVGLLLPMARWKWGSMVVGFLAILPIGAIIQYATLGGQPWEAASTFVVVIGALAIGLPVGRIYHELFRKQLRRDQ